MVVWAAQAREGLAGIQGGWNDESCRPLQDLRYHRGRGETATYHEVEPTDAIFDEGDAIGGAKAV